MIELSPTQRKNCVLLTKHIAYHLSIGSILAGFTHAQVWADHPRQPQAALICHSPRFYLAGSTTNVEFNAWLVEFLRAKLTSLQSTPGPGLILVYADHPGWDSILAEFYRENKTVQAQREYYEAIPQIQPYRAQLPDGYRLALADQDLLENPAIQGLEALREEMCSERDTIQEFLEKSFGIALLYQDQLAGWCLSEYNWARCCEVGIATLAPHQRRGLAALQTYAFMDLAIERGIQRIGWHCFANNRASAATALKTGFTKHHDYPVHLVWPLDSTDN